MVPLMADERTLVRYFTCLDIPKVSAHALAQTILHWIRFKGLTWTVAHLKDLKQQRIFFESGSERTLVHSHTDGTPKGAFRTLWDDRLPFAKALQALNVYTSVISDHITKAQAEKFVKAVNHVGPNFELDLSSVEVPRTVVTRSFRALRVKSPLSWIRATGKRAPVPHKGAVKTVPETRTTLADLVWPVADMSESNRALLSRHHILLAKVLKQDAPGLYAHIMLRMSRMPYGPQMYSDLRQPPVIGKIGLIQERGMKLRAVANPFRVWQIALTPLGDFLFEVLRTLEWDCTFDQSKGDAFIRDSLAQSKTLYAFDLSNATDRFPIKVQIDTVKTLLSRLALFIKAEKCSKDKTAYTVEDLDRSLNLFADLARGRWECGPLAAFNGNNGYLQWKTGQPLGLYPSFALFALTHGLLLRRCEDEVGVQGSFRVLGDDVIINHPEVASRYKEVILSLGCEISDTKSLVSKAFGEFAGKLVGQEGPVSVEKWKGFSPDEPFGPLKVLGIRGLAFVPSRYRRQVKKLAGLPKPFGLELNPGGVPLVERVMPVLDQLHVAKGEREVLTGYTLAARDRHEIARSWWRLVLINPDDALRVGEADRRTLTWQDEQSYTSDIVKIEHWNAYVKTLKPWDLPTIEKPSVESRLVDRSSSAKHHTKLKSVFYYLLRLFRKSRQ